jgi:glutathione S-transferase
MNTLYATRGSGNSLKPFLTMKQLGIPFRLVFVDVINGETRREKFLAINPAGTVPYLVTSDGRRLGESNAIAWYLAEETRLAPGTCYDRAQALQWMFFEQGNLEPFISPARFFISIVPHRRAERAEEIARWQARACQGLGILDGYLSGRDFITDSGYSVADIGVFGYTHVAAGAEIDLGQYPAVQRWMHRVTETSGFVSLSDMNDHASIILADDGIQAHAS